MQVQQSSSDVSQFQSAAHLSLAATLEQRALDAMKGDIPAAAKWMALEMLSDAEYMAENLTAIIEQWAEQRIRIKASHWRFSIIDANREGVAKGSFKNNLAAAIKAEATRFMNMPIFGGKPIGLATAEEIRQSAYRYGEVADDMKRKQAWQIAVAEALERSGCATVSDGLKESDLASMWAKLN